MPVVVEVAPEPMEVAVAIAPRALMVLPRGYFGFGISCRDCSVEIDDDSVPVWEFTHNPELTGVEPGMPAHDAGMRSGDILTHIDGSEMTSAEGGRLFGAVQPGDTVTFRFARNNTSREVQVVAEERTWARARVRAPAAVPVEPAVPLDPAMPAPPAQPTGIPSITRFTGVLGDTQVVVTGGPITVSRTDDQVIIVSGDVRVTLTRK
jgi:membrane-associated protease RseP (regulator of RpoE activity)